MDVSFFSSIGKLMFYLKYHENYCAEIDNYLSTLKW